MQSFVSHFNSPTRRTSLWMTDIVNGDVNALPDSKRRLIEVTGKVSSYMSQDSMNVDNLKQKIRDMEVESSQPTFWDDGKRAQSLLSEMNRVKLLVDRVTKWHSQCDDVETIIELAQESPSTTESFVYEAQVMLTMLEKDLDAFEVDQLLSGKYDNCGCMLVIQSGAGGTEANDWAGMLLRMYTRLCERRGFKMTRMDETPADFGVKSVELKIEGDFAYGYLRGEKGTHRLVRISPFNAQGKRYVLHVLLIYLC